MLASIILFIETAYIQADQLPNINIDVKKRYIIFFLSETTFLNRFHFLKNKLNVDMGGCDDPVALIVISDNKGYMTND